MQLCHPNSRKELKRGPIPSGLPVLKTGVLGLLTHVHLDGLQQQCLIPRLIAAAVASYGETTFFRSPISISTQKKTGGCSVWRPGESFGFAGTGTQEIGVNTEARLGFRERPFLCMDKICSE